MRNKKKRSVLESPVRSAQAGGGQFGLNAADEGLKLVIGEIDTGQFFQCLHGVFLKVLEEDRVLLEFGGQLFNFGFDVNAHVFAPFHMEYAGKMSAGRIML